MGLTQVSTDGVKNDAITKTKIPANQIEASELADNAVDTNAIADDAVTSAKLGASAVTTGKINDQAVTAAKIADITITSGQLASDSVTSAKIADQAVTLNKLPHGDGSSDGKFLRANNGADPTFETVTSTTINSNADNRVITGSGTANTLNGESGVTYDGTDFTVSSGRIKITDESSGAQLRLGASNDFQIEHDSANTYIQGITGDIVIQNDANVKITAKTGGTQRFRFDSDGLKFGTDTAAANALDDYEEGIHVMQPSGTSDFAIGGSYDEAPYTKIGRLVTLRGLIYISGVTGSGGYVRVTLPFTAANDSANVRYSGNIGTVMHNGVNTGDCGVVAYISGNSNRMGFYKISDNSSWSHLTASDLTVGDEMYFTISYEI